MKGPALSFLAGTLLVAAAIALPLGMVGDLPLSIGRTLETAAVAGFIAVLLALLAIAAFGRWRTLGALALIAAAILLAALQMQTLRSAGPQTGGPGLGALFAVAALVAFVLGSAALVAGTPLDRGGGLAPLLFFLLVLYLWELATLLYAIPRILLPAPSAIYGRIIQQWPTLQADFVQTVVRAAIPGLVLGSTAGFVLAVAVDRFARLSTAFQILGSLLAVVPILAVAPIMVLWLGFDWQSKVAVAALMTFFPMFTATGAGLRATGATETDLMQSYAASYGQTLRLVRLPIALPYIFSALKLNVPAAMVGAMIAEFFGTPIVGLGFRIASEAGRLSFDIVWAAIAVASAFSLLLYAAVGLADRLVTFWHPSHRN